MIASASSALELAAKTDLSATSSHAPKNDNPQVVTFQGGLTVPRMPIATVIVIVVMNCE
jgi:hypothetical protein